MSTVVVVGTGGAGKTTSAAALARTFADAGERVLVITLDPARRLFDAFGLSGPSSEVLQAYTSEGSVDVWMPTAADALRETAERTMGEEAEAFLASTVAELFLEAPAGLHEIVVLLALQWRLGGYTRLVVDTAPSIHALRAFELPLRLQRLFEGRTLALLEGAASGGRLGGVAQRALRRMLSALMPPRTLEAGARFFAALARARSPLIAASSKAEARFKAAAYMIVAAPNEASVRGAETLAAALEKRGTRPALSLLNRIDEGLEHEREHWYPDELGAAYASAFERVDAQVRCRERFMRMHAAPRLVPFFPAAQVAHLAALLASERHRFAAAKSA